MTLHPDARHTLVYELVRVFRPLSGVIWEPIGDILAESLAGVSFLHRGQGVKGNPQGYAVDSYTPEGDVAAQYGTAADYFDALKKPKADYDHVRRLLPQAKVVYLLSTQEATAKQFTEVTQWRDWVGRADEVRVDVYDAIRLAEHVVDTVIEDEDAYDALAAHLEPLRQLRDLHAAANNLPSLPAGVVTRAEVEEAVVAALDAHGIALLTGLSGGGKSVSALSVAHRLRGQFAWPVWTTELSVADVADLGAVDVARRGMRLNLEAMLRTRSCLLVLDDLQAKGPLEHVLDQIHRTRSADARVIITSQQFVNTPFTVEMTAMTPSDARQLIEHQTLPCPDGVFAAINVAVGGHPMALRLLNGLARDGVPWADLAAEASRVGELTVPERAQRLIDVVLAHRRAVLEKALALFAWCGTPRIHLGFFRSAVGHEPEHTLRRYGLVTFEADTIRLHDLVWSSLPTLDPPPRVLDDAFEIKLDVYVAGLADSDTRALLVKHLARVHQPLLSRLVRSGVWRPGHLYAWLQDRGPGKITVAMLPSAQKVAEAAAGDGTRFTARVACELAEAVVQLTPRDTASTPEAHAELLAPFDALLASPLVPAAEKVYVRHHRARALKLLGRHEEAVAELEDLLATGESEGGPPVVRLLLARTLTELPREVTVPDARARAGNLLLGLLREAKDAPDRVSVPVALAAAELLRRHAAGVNVEATLPEFVEFLEPLIVSAARRGLPFGPLAFGALAKAWRAVDGVSFWRVFQALPLPSVADVRDANERTAWGEVFENAAAYDPGQREENLGQALVFFSAADSAYGQSHAARLEALLGQPADAVKRLTELLGGELNARDRAWALRQLAEAYLVLAHPNDARAAASQACAVLPAGNNYESDFQSWQAGLSERADLIDSPTPSTYGL